MSDPMSRYASSGFAMLTTTDGREVVYRPARMLPPSLPVAFEYAAASGERLDVIAAQQLGDPLAFWRVCDANEAMNPFELVAGTALRIPAPEGVA